MISRDEEAIIALCTAHGSGALALMRIVGSDAYDKMAPLCRFVGRKNLKTLDSHTVHHFFLHDPETEQLLDEGMVIALRGPRTFTGQDTIEMTLHNNPCIIASVYDAAQRQGIRRAEPGEFSKRALLNDKIDILQAEAIHELINATNEKAVQASLGQLQGSLSSYVKNIEDDLMKALVLVEASFEFLDEEQRDLDFQARINQALVETKRSILEVLSKNSYQQRFKEGIRIALIGSVNAGKSTLFNALVGKNRAIVSPHAGTTRDTIEASLYQQGFFRNYVDTAGLRETNDLIEQEGIERSWQESQAADIILLVIDGSRLASDQEVFLYQELYKKYSQKIIIVWTKTDLGSLQEQKKNITHDRMYAISYSEKESLDQLREGLDKVVASLTENAQSSYMLNERHMSHLQHIVQMSENALFFLHEGFQAEMVAWHLKEALEHLSQLSGKSVTDRCHDEIFRTFCVGK
jgi:tRNA modification GTPase